MNMTGIQGKGPAFSEFLRKAELAEADKPAAPEAQNKISGSGGLSLPPGCRGIFLGISRCGRRVYPYYRQKEADQNT